MRLVRWAYLNAVRGTTCKHALASNGSRFALCGKKPYTSLDHWQKDEVGLNIREKCTRCLHLIKSGMYVDPTEKSEKAQKDGQPLPHDHP